VWRKGLLTIISFVLLARTVRAQGVQAPQVDPSVTSPPSTTGSTNLTNQANNPVAPLPELLVQNYLMPAPQGYDGRLADEELMRFYWPFMVVCSHNLIRIAMMHIQRLAVTYESTLGTTKDSCLN
jgi:hypothetical protein